ncbi:hypothetical protein C4J81_09580 [Deltaproteobacteria bacterium Smac51]|nr:hypothetical protein C4J81_09580 [Deltaproteobacteria bacterium Smac51]
MAGKIADQHKLPLLILVLAVGLLAAMAIIKMSLAWSFESKEARRMTVQQKILAYIEERKEQDFDFKLAAERLDLSYQNLADHLTELERGGRIKCMPRPPFRKPIVITLDDMVWYFWRVTIVPDEELVPLVS